MKEKRVINILGSLFLLFGFGLSFSVFSANLDLQKTSWGTTPVYYLSEKKLPLFTLIIEFESGATDDRSAYLGETKAALDLLFSGTDKFSKNELTDFMDFHAADVNSSVTHEVSTVKIHGLYHHFRPVIQKVCHGLSASLYPAEQVAAYKKIRTNALENLVANPSAVAARAFRRISMAGTAEEYPVGGTLKTISRLNSQVLQERLQTLRTTAAVKIYLSGPAEIKGQADFMLKHCSWLASKSANHKPPKENTKVYSRKTPMAGIYLLPLPQSTQAQVQIGRYLPAKLSSSHFVSFQILGALLGGNFTSLLMEEIRGKRHATYGIYAAISPQKNYGRAVISTSTKNDRLVEVLEVTKDILGKVQQGNFSQKKFTGSKAFLKGSYLFQFEKNDALLSQISYLQHIGKGISVLENFGNLVDQTTRDEVIELSKEVFSSERVIILVAGGKELLRGLKKLGKVEVLSLDSIL